MSVKDAVPSLPTGRHEQEAIASAPKGGNYKGFVAGIFSGITKLSVGYVVPYSS